MIGTRFLATALVVVASLGPVTMAQAATTKYTFENVTFPDGTSGVIEASTKTVKKTDYTVCNYYSEGHLSFLGYYQAPTPSGGTAAAVEQFCLDHYGDRTL